MKKVLLSVMTIIMSLTMVFAMSMTAQAFGDADLITGGIIMIPPFFVFYISFE